MKAYFINKVLATTVVGSYPVVKGSGLKSLFDPAQVRCRDGSCRPGKCRYRHHLGRTGQGRYDPGIFGKTPGHQGAGCCRKDPAGLWCDYRCRHKICEIAIALRQGDHHRPVDPCPRSPYQHPDVPEQGGTRTRSCRRFGSRSKIPRSRRGYPPPDRRTDLLDRCLPILPWENRPSMLLRER